MFKQTFTFFIILVLSLNVFAGGIVTTLRIDSDTIPIQDSENLKKLELMVTKLLNEDVSKHVELLFNEIKNIAKKYNLDKITGKNLFLKMQDGDIGFWQDQKLSALEYEIQFLSRKIVLDAANGAKVVIGDKGKLSFAAERLIQHIVSKGSK